MSTDVIIRSGASIFVQADAAVTSALRLSAVDNVFQTAASTITTNTLTVFVDSVDDDPGIGGSATLSGSIVGLQNTFNGNLDGDKLTGNDAANRLNGLGGNDRLFGNGGGDRLDGGLGDDLMNGGEGDDLLLAGPGVDQLIGGNGNDEVDYSAATGAVTVNRSTNSAAGEAAGDTFSSIESFTLSGFNDVYIGNGNTDHVAGAAGNDTLRGYGGLDALLGGAGNDTLFGGDANDHLTGSDNNDLLFGEAGIDQLDGGLGADNLNGGSGSDTLTGGDGTDTFRITEIAGVDTIIDFVVTDDTVALGVAAFTSLSAGTLSAANFRTGGAAADANDFIIYNNVTGRIFYDPDGNGAAAQTLIATVTPGLVLTNTDFIGV